MDLIDGLKFEKNVYLPNELAKSRKWDLLKKWEVLFNNTNSQELVWKTVFFDLEWDYFCSNHLTRLEVNTEKIMPEYLTLILNWYWKKKVFYNTCTNWNNQSWIWTDLLSSFKIPLPLLEVQQEIVETMDRVINTKKRLENEADMMLAGTDDWLLGELGIEKEEKEEKKVFVVNSLDARWCPLSAEFFSDFWKRQKDSLPLSEIADINPSRNVSFDKNKNIPYVWLPETDDGQVKEVLMRPFSEIWARNIIKKWDILFARIEPSIFNKKYIFVDDLRGNDFAFTSTEFYVLEGKKGVVNQKYLYYLLFSNPVYSQFSGKTTGSTGRRRLDRQVFENIQIPLPPLHEQERIAEYISSIIETARVKRDEARRIYEEARKEVEKMMLDN